MRCICFTITIFLLAALPAFASDSLRLVTSLDPIEAAEYIEAFQKDTGINVQWIRLSAGEALSRLKAEAENPTQDVWFGAPSSELAAAAEADLLERHSSGTTRNIPFGWRDPDGYWTGIYFGAIAFISGKGVKPPTSWQNLLTKPYKGEIAVSYPYTAGTGFTVLSGLIAIMGEEAAFRYCEKLDSSVRHYTNSGGAPIMEVGLGEAGVGIAFDQDALRKGKARGLPVTITYPSDGVPYEIGGVAIVKGGDRKLAARFVDWAASLAAQNLMHRWYRVPLAAGAEINPGSRRPETLPLAQMDFQDAGERREELIRKWRERVGR
ncbi:MAG: extracellular solute-binding protein [Pseudomonadota bacterium]